MNTSGFSEGNSEMELYFHVKQLFNAYQALYAYAGLIQQYLYKMDTTDRGLP